uniref:Uncharacterized protein n=1 Tax=Methanococcus maripaludis (strain C6 / ATCC BAA-1332) TaxID=444158 RepID=A9A859_METM6
MLQNKSILKYALLPLILMIMISSANAINLGDLTASSTKTTVTKSFDIDKIENYRYILNYTHYGNIGSNPTYEAAFYLNGEQIEKYSKENDIWFGLENKPVVSYDITSKLKNGTNTIEIRSNLNETRYYSFKNIQISEPSKPLLSLPVTPEMNFLSIFAILVVLKKFK